MKITKQLLNVSRSLTASAAVALFLPGLSARAQTVWNVNVGAGTGSGTNQITTVNNYTGAAPENTANSTWNAVSTAGQVTLADSTGNNGAGVTLAIIAGSGSVVQFGNQNLTSGDKIFNTWIKDGTGPSPDIVNDDPFTVTFGNLNPSATYDLVVYADWWWGPEGNPVQQTAGSGLTGTFHINSQQGGTHVDGVVPALMEDTNPANVATNPTNYARFRGLTPNAVGNLSFTMGGVNAPINGFQLIQLSAGPPDATPPTPSPMTWASPPVTTGSTSITMTATAASDTSGVEYYFDETSGNPGGTDSGWQSSPVYTNTGLNPGTTYTYTVTARDRSSALNTTAASTPASATTPATPPQTVWNVQFASQAGNQITTSENFIGAATENAANSTWNRVASLPQTGMVLKKSTGENTAVTLDFNGGSIGTQNVLTGDKIFNSRVGGGSTSTLTIKGLSMTNSYDMVIYSDWWWRNGDALPITQTLGSGLTGTVHLNRILSGTNGYVPALTPDTNFANVTSGSGNTGNWMRLNGLVPTLAGELSFRLTDGNNTPFNGFQLVATPIAPKADILAMSLASNPPSIQNAVISGTNVTLTVPFGTNLTNLAPTYSLWPDATCSTPSGTARNFSTPQTYTVTSSDSLVTKNYLVTVVVAPPLPDFELTAPASWDGRATITAQPVLSNLALLQANNGTNFTYNWSTSGIAVTQTTSPGVMTFTRSQGSGVLTVTLTMNNGTENVIRSTTINVTEPATDPWVERTPLANEKPVTNQFFARNPFTNLGTIHYRGTQSGTPDDVFLKVYRTPSGGSESLYTTLRQPLAGEAYDFTATIEAGLFTYRVVYGNRTSGVDTDVATVNNILCGDAFIIEGQSNAQATANDDSAANPQVNTSDPWVRTYDASLGWSPAYAKPLSPEWGSKVGYWGMKLAQDIVAQHSMPVCLINGAVGGTYIAQHQPNPVDRTIAAGTYDIYANLLNRVIAARLTHGIRGIFWHQGESDSATFGPPLEPDYLSYEWNFLNMSSAWKQDFPNFQRYIIFQVAPNPCSIGPFASEVREIQRQLPRLYSNMSIVNTIAIPGYGGCHYSKAGYENLAARVLPVVKRDFYGVTYSDAVTPPNLVRARFTSSARTAIALQFDQPMNWNSFSLPNWHVNDVAGQVTSGSASGETITLQLASAASADSTLDYVKDTWNHTEGVSTLLYGTNTREALTFANVPIESLGPYESWASSKGLLGPDATGNADPDNDGVRNALEFVLGGEPNPSSAGANSVSLLPVSSRSPEGDLVFVFARKTSSVGTVSLTFEWSGNLTFPPSNSVPVGAEGSSEDGILVSISPLDSTTQTVRITVPSARAMNGKLFGRLNAVVP
jgi:hypothetical protein